MVRCEKLPNVMLNARVNPHGTHQISHLHAHLVTPSWRANLWSHTWVHAILLRTVNLLLILFRFLVVVGTRNKALLNSAGRFIPLDVTRTVSTKLELIQRRMLRNDSLFT